MFYWDSKENTFATKKMQVPVIEDKFVIFTPRCLVRGKLVEDAPRILRVFIVGVLQELDYEQHKNETDYKKKSKKQIKKEIKEKNPNLNNKQLCALFFRSHHKQINVIYNTALEDAQKKNI